MDFARFKEAVERIRDKCDILINLTTSGMEFSEEVRLKPLNCGLIWPFQRRLHEFWRGYLHQQGRYDEALCTGHAGIPCKAGNRVL